MYKIEDINPNIVFDKQKLIYDINRICDDNEIIFIQKEKEYIVVYIKDLEFINYIKTIYINLKDYILIDI